MAAKEDSRALVNIFGGLKAVNHVDSGSAGAGFCISGSNGAPVRRPFQPPARDYPRHGGRRSGVHET